MNGHSLPSRATGCGPADTITITLPEPPRTGKVEPQAMDLDIRYEDADLLTREQARGYGCAPRLRPLGGHASKWTSPPPLPTCPRAATARVRPGLVHRIDKDTSGLLISG